MPFNFIVRFSFFPSIMLSGARRPLATGCFFNKSDKAFLWLAACSLELGWPGRHCFPQAPHLCPEWGGGGQRMPGTQSRDLSAGSSSATHSRLDFRQSLETADLLCSVRIRQGQWLYSILSSKTQFPQVQGATEVSPWKDLALGHYSPGLCVCVCFKDGGLVSALGPLH